MKTFEYQFKRLDHGIGRDMEQELTNFGQHGWEVIWAERNGVRWTFLLKKEGGFDG